MCYHYNLVNTRDELGERFKVSYLELNFEPTYHSNGFSFRQMPVITQEAPNSLQLFNWGLVPFWVKDTAQAHEMRQITLNCKSETAFEKPSFREPIKKRRCLVPASGFFEWREHEGKKYPYYIFSKDITPMALAGIYDCWTDRETGEILSTFSILTTEANSYMAQIHNTKKRMPVILHPDNEQLWLDPTLDKNSILELVKPYHENGLNSFNVSKLITSKTQPTNVPEVMEQFYFDSLPSIYQ